MKFTSVALSIVAVVFLLSSCKKEQSFESVDLGYSFFPNQTGSYKEYIVDSINYGITVDSSHFYLREVITETYIDNSNQPSNIIERYVRTNPEENWELTDVWVQKKTNTTAERIEENRRYVRLIFPMNEGETWNGNAYNSDVEEIYKYEAFDQIYELENIYYPKTVTVIQKDNVNLVDQEIAFEVYARGIGLVHRKFTDLNFQEDETTGTDVEWRLIARGIVE